MKNNTLTIATKNKNWSNNLKWESSEVFYPNDEDEIIHLVKTSISSGRKIKVVGKKMTFSPIIAGNDIQINMSRYQGIESIDHEHGMVTVKSGSTLKYLSEELDKVGLALAILGDVNEQTVGGAISTGYHGSGLGFPLLNEFIEEITFINGNGEKVTCSKKKDKSVFKAAVLSLGTMGIITTIKIKCVPQYILQINVQKKTIEDISKNYMNYCYINRNFEFFCFPNTDIILTKSVNVTQREVNTDDFKDFFYYVIFENFTLKLLCELSYFFKNSSNQLCKVASKALDTHVKINKSYKIYSVKRLVRFNELEYMIPLENFKDCFAEVVAWINQNNRDICFPIEVRFLQADQIYLSPAYQQNSACLSFHAYYKKDYKTYFAALENIMLRYGGRPHWATLHTLGYDQLKEKYPEMTTFNQIRRSQDPNGIFMNEYTHLLLGT